MDRLFLVCRIRRWPPGRSTFPVAGFNTPNVLRRRSAVSLLPMATSSQLGWLLLGCSVRFEVFSALRGCAELRVEVETALTLRFDYDRPHGLGADQVIWGRRIRPVLCCKCENKGAVQGKFTGSGSPVIKHPAHWSRLSPIIPRENFLSICCTNRMGYPAIPSMLCRNGLCSWEVHTLHALKGVRPMPPGIRNCLVCNLA